MGLATTGSFELTLEQLRARPGTKWHRYPDDIIPAWIAEMDFDVAEPIHELMRHIAEVGAYGYEDPTLYPSLSEAFAEYMQRRYAWSPDAEFVVPVADLVQALFTAVSAFTDPGQGAILHTPIYPPFLNSIRELGRRVVEHPLVDDGTRFIVDTDSLRQRLDTDTPLLLLCNPHNPTGRVLERHELQTVAEVAVERDLVVVADEVHADLTYAGHQHIPFASLGPAVAERTVTITSATKAYNIPGMRCGLMHFGSARLFERFRSRLPDRFLGRVNRFGVEATVVAWRECAAWLEAVMEALQRNREYVAQLLAAELPEVRYYSPEASFLAWLDCRGLELGASPQQFFLERARVALHDGSEFGAAGRGHVRLNFATSQPILEELFERMKTAVRRDRLPT